MRTFDELERLWRDAPPPQRERGSVHLICVRKLDGTHETPPHIRVTSERGVEGDRWYGNPDRKPAKQVTLMSVHAAALVTADHAPLHLPGDNFLVDLDLTEAALPTGTRLLLGSAVLEVSAEPHTGCKKFSARFGLDALRWVNDQRHLRLRGVNCRVLHDGEVALGDAVERLRPDGEKEPAKIL